LREVTSPEFPAAAASGALAVTAMPCRTSRARRRRPAPAGFAVAKGRARQVISWLVSCRLTKTHIETAAFPFDELHAGVLEGASDDTEGGAPRLPDERSPAICSRCSWPFTFSPPLASINRSFARLNGLTLCKVNPFCRSSVSTPRTPARCAEAHNIASPLHAEDHGLPLG
jgi:hypothetical protein